MKYWFTIALSGCLLLLNNQSVAQSEGRVIRGFIKDQQTLQLSFSHFPRLTAARGGGARTSYGKPV
jgi:hypothetical protein